MASHLKELILRHDAYIAGRLATQIRDRENPRYGGYLTEGYHVDPRFCGFTLGDMIIGYLCKGGAYYKNAELLSAIEANFDYMEAHQRPDGCVDLSDCNFASPPDTAFMCNHLFNAYWLMDKSGDAAVEMLKKRLYAYIERCCEGVAAGGFHTPNHRWAIASCLMSAYKLMGREDFKARAGEYLNEGLDINEDGEFAERSAGNYNQVNDDQMIRLYLATGDKRFLEASRRNLDMMRCYIEPDNSVFTNNSTRQDYGRKVYLESYYILFLLTGYLLGDKKLGAMAEWIYSISRERMHANGDGFALAWLLLYEDLDGYGADEPLKHEWLSYNRYFRDSRIARVRKGDFSYTVMEGKPNFLYFQHGSYVMYMVIHGRVCSKGNFIADSIEPIEGGYRLHATFDSWYYLPFYPEKPATSDWWAMDNPNTRRRTHGVAMDMTVEVTLAGDGIDVRVKSTGLDEVPLRVELGFEAGSQMRTSSVIIKGKAGDAATLVSGEAEMTGPHGEVITIGPGFAQHNNLQRRDGVYPQSAQHFIVYMNAYSPIDQTIHIGTSSDMKCDLL